MESFGCARLTDLPRPRLTVSLNGYDGTDSIILLAAGRPEGGMAAIGHRVGGGLDIAPAAD